MTLVRIRNNSESLITLPAIGNHAGTVKGPIDAIRLPPSTTTPVESSRLEMYESPAFLARFDEGKNGERADLEIMRPDAPVKTTADLLKAYEEQHGTGEASEAEVKPSSIAPRVTSSGAPVMSAPGTSGALPASPVGSALDVAG